MDTDTILTDLISNCTLTFDARKRMDYTKCRYNKEDYSEPKVCEIVKKTNDSIVFNLDKLSQSSFFPKAYTLHYKNQSRDLILFALDRDDIPTNRLNAIEYCHDKFKKEDIISFKTEDNKTFLVSLEPKWVNNVNHTLSDIELFIGIMNGGFRDPRVDALLEVKFFIKD